MSLIKLGDLGVHLVAGGKAVGTLFAAFAAQFRFADKAGNALAHGDLDPRIDDGRNGAGDHRALLDVALAGFERVLGKLLEAEADAFFRHIHIKHLGLDHLAFLVFGQGVFAGFVPRKVRQVGHAVDFARQADEQPELGDVLDFAFHFRTHGVLGHEGFPGVVAALLEAEADAAFFRIRIQHDDFHFLAGGNDLARVDIFFGPAHFGNVDQPLDARFQFDEGAVIGDVGDPAGKPVAYRIGGLDVFPRVRFKLFHAQGNALGFGVEANDLHLDGFTDLQRVCRMVDTPPGDIGDVQQAIDTAQVDEGAVIGDILDHPFQNLAFLEVGDQFGTGIGAGFFQHGAAGNDDVVARPVHLENLERLRRPHERADIAHRANVHLAAGQEGDGAGQIDDEAALDPAENNAVDPFGGVEGLFQFGPGFLAAGLFTAQADDAVLVFVTLNENIDRIAGIDHRFLTGDLEFLDWHPAFRFKTDIDEDDIGVGENDRSLDHPAFETAIGAQGFFQKFGEIFGDGGSRVGAAAGVCLSHGVGILCLLLRFPASRLVPAVFEQLRNFHRPCLAGGVGLSSNGGTPRPGNRGWCDYPAVFRE